MKKYILAVTLIAFSGFASAAAHCVGTIKNVYKWHHMASLSVIVELTDGSTTNWIGLPTKSDESMALMAFAANKPVTFYWATSTVTDCKANGGDNTWSNNTSLDGYFSISH